MQKLDKVLRKTITTRNTTRDLMRNEARHLTEGSYREHVEMGSIFRQEGEETIQHRCHTRGQIRHEDKGGERPDSEKE